MNRIGHKTIWRRASTRLPAALLLAVCALLLTARAAFADTQTAATSAVTFTDETGRSVKVPTQVRRIVSLAPNLTEIVYALGAGDRLAGDTDFCDFPAEARSKPHIGGPVNPSIEQIVKLMPDVVLATKSINRRETVAALDRLGVPVFVTDPHSVDDMISSIGHIGAVLQAGPAAATLAANLRAQLADIAQRLADTQPARVFFVVWTAPLISIGDSTFLADALRHAGARSVLEISQEWPRVSLEELARLQPGYLVFADADAQGVRRKVEELRALPGWRELEALQQDRVIVISDAINRPAPRMVNAIEQLARALHPQSFGARSNGAELPEETCACAR